MVDSRVQNLARILVDYSTQVRPKDQVAIYASITAAPLLEEVYRLTLRAGGYPSVFCTPDTLSYIFYREANDDQLARVSPFDEIVRREFDVLIGIGGGTNTRALSSIDPKRQSAHARARAGLLETFMRRSASGELRWVGTQFPTAASAQDAEMSLEEFEDFVYATTYSDRGDPVASWQTFHAEQARLLEWLEGRRRVRVEGPSVDMTLSIEGRSFVNCDGRHNMPDGEIFTGPVEDSVNGWVRFSYPAVLSGREVSGVELTFEAGRVVRASADKNEAFLLSMLDADEGARRLGEWAIGTNKQIDRFVRDILFDEKLGGTIHMALGSGYPETGSVNKSAIHWDMICDMRDGGRIYVDDELFYDSGTFVI